MSLPDIAEARFRQGYSCSQSVFSALAERFGIEPELSLRVSAGFGGGMARSAKTCGCVTGALMAIGLAQRSVGPEENKSEKEKTYETCRRFMRAFEARNDSLICVDLLGCDLSTPEGHAEARQKGLFQSRCTKLVRDAVEIVQDLLATEPPAGPNAGSSC